MQSIIEWLNAIIWSKALIFMCLAAGLYFSFATRFMQVRGFVEMLRLTVRGQ
ncbi:MAG TPA: sodium:alanine symporter, partial [Stenotrophomonas sp.]|nr:sodium:alanine symporter [Stenotrophomonas sp.]